jgi:hypothetical protein
VLGSSTTSNGLLCTFHRISGTTLRAICTAPRRGTVRLKLERGGQTVAHASGALRNGKVTLYLVAAHRLVSGLDRVAERLSVTSGPVLTFAAFANID